MVSKVQTLGLAEPTETRDPRDIGALGGLLLFPILLIGGTLSIPIALAMRNSDRARERRFAKQMRSANRTISQESLAKQIHTGAGTLIREWKRMFKGPVRWWWTSDDLYKECPHAAVDHLTLWQDDGYRAFIEWCWSHYTSPASGKAFLVQLPHSRGRSSSTSRKYWSNQRAGHSDGGPATVWIQCGITFTTKY